MKKFISACMGPFILLSVFAQSGSTLLKPDVPKVIPPAPNAASLGKFGEIPVNYSSGIPSIGHPIFSWGRGKLNVSLGLSYHAGGHKVEDMPSDVGLGWSLTGVARVSRAARGLPDDDPINGFIHTPAAPQSVTYNYPQQIPAAKNGFIYFNEETMGAVTADLGFVPYNNADYGYFKEVSDNAKDGEQDVFNYSAGSKSGKFVINRNKEVVHLEHTTAKIAFTTYPLNHASIPLRGRIKSFTITDDNGVIYLFEETETQSAETTTSGNTSLSANPISSYTASWLITKITDPNTQEEITFNYQDQASTYEGSFSQSKSYRLKSTLYNNNSGPEAGAWETEIWSADYGLEESDGGFSFSTINQQQKKISSINLPDGSIIEFQYQMNRADLAGDKALGKILVRNSRNKTIKNVQLNHSYFITPAGELPIVTTNTSNDFLKRLRLDEVVEASVSGPAVSRTKFEYNTLPLNRRDSRNTDYWGYNVNPARNNTALVPKIRLKEEDLPQNLANGIYLGGANRAPDETWCKAGALEKIIYPTGGYTVFEYEPNKAFSAINYYENELQTGEIIFQEAEWNVNKTISFPGRANTLVDFYCKTNEPNLRSPNNGCLEEQQDALPVKMVITSTDGTVTMEIENTYANFLAGFWRSVQLPLNKTYRVKFVYNYSVPCEYQFPFTAHIQGKYYIPLQDKQAGGLRIKKILNYDGLGGVLTKEYDYNKPDGHSSATLHRLPNFDYTKSSESFVVTWGYGYKHFYNRYFKRTSSPNQSLEYLSGSPLLYTKVTEKISGHGVIEREFNDLGATYLGTGLYPFQPTPDLSFASSLPTREAVKDAAGNLKTEKLFTYNTIINSIPVTGNTNLKTGVVGSSPTGSPVIVVSTYIPQTGRAELIQTVNKQYENGTVLTTTENNTYDGSRYYLKSSQTKNSKQEEIITYFDYPADFNGTAPYSDMVLKNMIAAPVQQTQHNMATPLASEMVRVKTNYQTWNGNTFIGASTIQQSISGGPAKTVFTTNKYDAKGNILQTTDKAGIVTSYIWGYNGMYPVAQITGADHNTVIAFVNQALINNPNTTDQQMRDELNLIRTGLAGTKAQVTTFTHEPLIGITSQTDANNRTVFYEYDGHNRLTLLRNQDGFIVKKICYKYNGEPEDCGQPMYGNEVQSMIFIRNNCGAGYTGSAVTYTVAANTWFSAVSVAEANALALAAINANGQAFANNNGNCVPANPCGTCPGPDKKCINNVCETGIRVNTNSYQDLVNGYWVCEYHYEFSDGSWSETLTENNSYPCFVGN